MKTFYRVYRVDPLRPYAKSDEAEIVASVLDQQKAERIAQEFARNSRPLHGRPAEFAVDCMRVQDDRRWLFPVYSTRQAQEARS